MRSKSFILFSLLFLVAGLLSALPTPATVRAQDSLRLDACRRGAFSTEEDFMMQSGEPADGNPYISDGDVLSPTGEVCARNADLIRRLVDIPVDLGLDALDILDFDPGLVAFSTELDSPFGNFTAGDLLTTSGIVIPNLALVSAFGITYNVGLDELKFMGKRDDILRFLEFAAQVSPDEWQQGILPDVLRRFNIDLWFSIEGTVWNADQPILDGDILSATGTIIATNYDLLAPSVPAGLPKDGVDFGVDAFAVPREALGTDRPEILFSTEILYDEQPPFTDGDVLKIGGGVVITNEALVDAFKPSARFLGLDALWMSFDQASGPRLTHLCDLPTIQFDGGTVAIGGSGTGLHASPLASPPALTNTLTQPCGLDVPIRGFLTTNPLDPVGNVTRFRVAYREASEPVPAAAGDPSTSAVTTTWTVYSPKLEWNGMSWSWECTNPVTLATDANGWMNAQDFMNARYGMGPFVNFWIRCDNPELRLAVWSTGSLPVGETDADGDPTGYPRPGVQDREDHYVLWLEWEDTSLTLHREDADHNLQLDNTLPVIADYPDGLQLRLPDGTTIVPACGETGPNADQLQVWGQFDDRYYLGFSLLLRGGNPPVPVSYGLHYYYDPTDGTAALKNTDDTGTMPDATTVHLRDIFMTDLGASFEDCCYVLDIYVYDRAIRHSFNGEQVNVYAGVNYSNAFMTFSATP
ncbi:MAG TPA: hypothetical protein VHP83_16055 [Aggregatilineaceae bacterium]|nr:hypothetical protein [Aggregatilineaceae bacterium]